MARDVLPTAPDGAAQVVFYDAGVGTEGGWLLRMLGGVSGKGIEKNIRDCYRFLVHNYQEGDEIYLFGFSRGAYTVRSLAGMIRNVGVLRKSEAERLQAAYRLYRRSDAAPGSEEAVAFRAAHSRGGRHHLRRGLGHSGGAGHPAAALGEADGGPPPIPRRRVERDCQARLPRSRH